MKLVHDYIHVFEALWEDEGKCRIRVYREENGPTVFICTEVPDNKSGSIVTMSEHIAANVWKNEGAPEPFVWIEHYPAALSPNHVEEFHRVTFARPDPSSFYNPRGEAMDRDEVEKLIGQQLE